MTNPAADSIWPEFKGLSYGQLANRPFEEWRYLGERYVRDLVSEEMIRIPKPSGIPTVGGISSCTFEWHRNVSKS